MNNFSFYAGGLVEPKEIGLSDVALGQKNPVQQSSCIGGGGHCYKLLSSDSDKLANFRQFPELITKSVNVSPETPIGAHICHLCDEPPEPSAQIFKAVLVDPFDDRSPSDDELIIQQEQEFVQNQLILVAQGQFDLEFHQVKEDVSELKLNTSQLAFIDQAKLDLVENAILLAKDDGVEFERPYFEKVVDFHLLKEVLARRRVDFDEHKLEKIFDKAIESSAVVCPFFKRDPKTGSRILLDFQERDDFRKKANARLPKYLASTGLLKLVSTLKEQGEEKTPSIKLQTFDDFLKRNISNPSAQVNNLTGEAFIKSRKLAFKMETLALESLSEIKRVLFEEKEEEKRIEYDLKHFDIVHIEVKRIALKVEIKKVDSLAVDDKKNHAREVVLKIDGRFERFLKHIMVEQTPNI